MFTNLNCLNTASRHGLGSGAASFCVECAELQAAAVEMLSGIGYTRQTQNIWLQFIQCLTNIKDVGPTLLNVIQRLFVCWLFVFL